MCCGFFFAKPGEVADGERRTSRHRLKLGRATRAAGHADGQLRRSGVPASRFESLTIRHLPRLRAGGFF